MQILAESIHELEPGQVLVGQTPTMRELLKLWIHRHEMGFDLYLARIVEDQGPLPNQLRNIVGRDFVSCAEVLEALNYLEEICLVAFHVLKNLPVKRCEATPELLQLLEAQISRVARSPVTGEFGPDDLPAELIQLRSVRAIEALESDEDLADLVLVDP